MSTNSMSDTQSSMKSTLTLPSDLEIEMSRIFNAPRELVWKALTDPAMIGQWWGQRGSTTIIDKFDLQPGGAWRFVQRTPDGSEHGFRGEFREIEPPTRLVQTFEWEGMPGHISVGTTTLEEVDGKTKITDHSHFANVEDRDGMLASGMEGGANESWDQLGELLAKLQA